MMNNAITAQSYGVAMPQRPEISPVPDDSNRAQQQPANQATSSDIGPAVVANFSAAALESSRAVTGAEQTADNERSADLVEREDRGIAQIEREEQARQQSQEPQRYSSVSVVV